MKNTRKQILVTLTAAAGILVAVTASLASKDSFEQQSLEQKAPEFTHVATFEVEAQAYHAEVVGYGSATPHYSLTLTNEVSGRVLTLSPRLQSGETLQRDELLIGLDQRPYQQALANAKFEHSNARVALLQEELNRDQAQQEWQRSGLSGQPDSELVLRQPQLQAAQDKLHFTAQALIQAQADLDKTNIKAPFDALVVNRTAQPGAYLQAGAEVAQLYSTEVMDISIPLSANQWQQLPALELMINQRWPVDIVSPEQDSVWRGYVSRAEQHLNQSSRQRALIVSIDRPLQQETALHPGTFVQVKINGALKQDLWKLPASSISQDQKLWFLSDDSTLKAAHSKVLFAINNSVFVKPVTTAERTKVLTNPLSSYLPGMKVIDSREDQKP